MGNRKYKQGKRITSLQEFEKTDCIWFEIHCSGRFKMWHRSALESLQVHTLKHWLYNGRVFETIQVKQEPFLIVDEFLGEDKL